MSIGGGDVVLVESERTIPYGLLPDWAIRGYIPITPFSEGGKREGKISYGVGSYGYDARLGTKFKVFNPVYGGLVLDPKNIDERLFQDVEGDFCVIPPNSFVLGETVEWFEIPRDVLGICTGKSTYARCAVNPPITPLEPSWKGKITIEIANNSPIPVKVYANEGIIQINFHRAMAACEKSYADGHKKYQNQQGLVLAKVD